MNKKNEVNDEHEKSENEDHRQTYTTDSTEKEELLKEGIKKEAAILKAEREIQSNKKEIKSIEESNTWKYSKPIRRINDLFVKSIGQKEKMEQSRYLKELENKLDQTETELHLIKERVNELMLDDRKLNSRQLLRMVHEKKLDSEILDFIRETVKSKKQHETNYRNALSYAARVYMNEKDDYKNLVYSKALKGLKIEEIPEIMIRAGLTDNPISLRQAASFRGSLNMRMRQKQLVEPLPEWLLDDKKNAYRFMKHLGVQIPEISDKVYRLEEIPKQDGIVIKPLDGAGSRGVYLVYSPNDIIDIKRGKKMNSWEDLINSMKKDVFMGWVRHNEWFIEKLVLENKQEKTPASDIKFYCFYGKVGLILEITRVPKPSYCWWTATGERVRTGKYDEDLFKGTGVSQSEINLAAEISLKIPAPFVRIDFLRAENGLIFGEFTPKPGNYDEFDEPTDKWLGDLFLEAQGNLNNDFLDGKNFNEYKQYAANIKQ